MIEIAFMKCYSGFVRRTLIQAAAKLGSEYKIDNKRLNCIQMCCDLIDSMDNACHIVGYTGRVDIEDSRDLMITMTCQTLRVQDKSDNFYKILNETKELTVNPSYGEYLDVSFVFDGIFIPPKDTPTQVNGLIFDFATIAIAQTSDKRGWKNNENVQKWIDLSICCDVMDSFMKCVGGQIEKLLVNEDEKQIAIRILSPSYTDDDILSETTWWPYQWMREKMEQFVKVDLEDDNVLTVAVFDGVWDF